MSKFKINKRYIKNNVTLEILERFEHFVKAKVNDKIKKFHLCTFDNQEIIFTDNETFITAKDKLIYIKTGSKEVKNENR